MTQTYKTTTEDSFYKGEPLAVQCKASDIPEGNSLWLGLLLGGSLSFTCQRNFNGWVSTTYEIPHGVVHRALTDDDCDLTNKDQTMSVNFNITEGLLNKNITCRDENTGIHADSFLVISAVKCEYKLTNIKPYNIACHQLRLWHKHIDLVSKYLC